jgi:hypothetical protein
VLITYVCYRGTNKRSAQFQNFDGDFIVTVGIFFVFKDFIDLFKLIGLHVNKFYVWERGLQNLKHII